MSTDQAAGTRTEELLALADRYAAHNYHPLPVVIAEAEGAWVTDVEREPLPRHAGGVPRAELRSPASPRSSPRRTDSWIGSR